MDLDFWWLLVIPVAFALGWMASRATTSKRCCPKTRTCRARTSAASIFCSTSSPTRRSTPSSRSVKLDPETVELHFALGNLFRRRGETDRAIRVHQNLLSRADLPVAERDHALYELGQDFLKAGLLDRAEETFRSLDEPANTRSVRSARS